MSEIEPRPISICPLIRCSLLEPGIPVRICGRPAPWEGRSRVDGLPVFHCDVHRQPEDTPLREPLVFQQVELHGSIRLASAPWSHAIAQAEAMLVLEAAVRQAGGLLNIRDVTTAWVRYWPEGHTGRATALAGRG